MRHGSQSQSESDGYLLEQQAQAEEYEREIIGQMTIVVYTLAAFLLALVTAAILVFRWILH